MTCVIIAATPGEVHADRSIYLLAYEYLLGTRFCPPFLSSSTYPSIYLSANPSIYLPVYLPALFINSSIQTMAFGHLLVVYVELYCPFHANTPFFSRRLVFGLFLSYPVRLVSVFITIVI